MEYELYHYGRKGMKWYQNIFTKGKEASAARKKRKAEKAAKAEEKRKESVEEQKTRIRNSRSAEQVYKNAHLFNDKELNEIYQRLNTEESIKRLIPEKVNKGKKFIENSASTIRKVGTLVGNTTDMVNKFKAFGKLFGGDKKATTNTSGSASKPAGKTKDNKPKPESKPDSKPDSKIVKTGASALAALAKASSDSKVERVTNFDILDRASKNTQSTRVNPAWAKRAMDINSEVDWSPSVDTKALARSMTNNIAGRTVNWAMNNPSRIESGRSFASGLLALPAPKDRD